MTLRDILILIGENNLVDLTINYNNELLSTVSGNPCELLKDLENDELKKEIHGINALDEDYLEIYLLVRQKIRRNRLCGLEAKTERF